MTNNENRYLRNQGVKLPPISFSKFDDIVELIFSVVHIWVCKFGWHCSVFGVGLKFFLFAITYSNLCDRRVLNPNAQIWGSLNTFFRTPCFPNSSTNDVSGRRVTRVCMRGFQFRRIGGTSFVRQILRISYQHSVSTKYTQCSTNKLQMWVSIEGLK